MLSTTNRVVSTVANKTGVSWFSALVGCLLAAFILYIAANGDIVKYRQILLP